MEQGRKGWRERDGFMRRYKIKKRTDSVFAAEFNGAGNEELAWYRRMSWSLRFESRAPAALFAFPFWRNQDTPQVVKHTGFLCDSACHSSWHSM